MAVLTNQERNTIRKVIRLLDMRENAGQPAYDSIVDQALSHLREMMQPTEKYKLHVPEEWDIALNVAWYETDAAGVKHLYLTVTSPASSAPTGEGVGEGGTPPDGEGAAVEPPKKGK